MESSTKRAPLALGIVVVLVALAILSSCTAPLVLGRTGSVMLNLNHVQAQSILPPISLDAAEFLVSGAGPAGAVYGPELFTGSTTIERLVPGSWTWNVIARNAAHNDIGQGTGSVTVFIGQTAVCNITVAEYSSPDGSFLLDLAWEPDIVDHPVWTGTLKDFSGTIANMGFNVDEVACTAQSLNDPLHVGWFTMIVQLFDAPTGPGSEVLSTGAAAAVRIAAGRQTHGDLFLHAVQGFGQVDLRLELDFHNPLVLSPNVAFGEVGVYANGEYSFSVSADETCTAVYYLRGQQVGVDGYTLHAGELIMNESYRLDVVAFNVDGSRAASGTWNVRHEEFPPGAFAIVGQATNGQAGSATMLFRLYDSAWTLLTLQEIVAPAGSVGSYSFTGLAEGSYYLGMQFQGSSTMFWVAPGTWNSFPSGATLVAIPGVPPSAHVCDFGLMN